jgi:hypothetical protein
MQHAHDAEADGVQPDSPAAAPAGARLLTVPWLQASAGNAAVGRLLRRGALQPGRRGRDRRLLQREQVAALTPPTFDACGWINADEVKSFLDERDTRIRELLPTFDIATDSELDWFLKRWFNSTSCIEQAVATWFSNDTRMLDRVRQQYKDAVRVILVRAEIGTGKPVSQLLSAKQGLIRQDAAQMLTDFGNLDRFDRLDPSRSGPAAAALLRVINPAAMAFTKYPCTQNCPAAATAVQAYLRTGVLTRGQCNPMNEPSGYAIDPGPDTWGPSRSWANAWKAIVAATPRHGTFVLVEADRGPNHPATLTQWHYFVVLNVRGVRIVVDGFLGMIQTDIDAYVNRLRAVTYKFTSQAVTATPVRSRP